MKKTLFSFLSIVMLNACNSNSSEAQQQKSTASSKTSINDDNTVFDNLSASSINISDIPADVDVKVQKNGLNYITIIISGPDSLRKKYKATLNGSTATLKSEIDNKQINANTSINIISSNGSNSITIGSGSSMSNSSIVQTNGDEVYVNGQKISPNSKGDTIIIGPKTPSVHVDVYIPQGTKLNLENIFGNTIIGDIQGDIAISSKNGNNFSMGSVRNVSVSSTGSGDISIKNIHGNFNASMVGSGDATIRDGAIGSLVLNMTGSGDFSFMGIAGNTSINKTGSGDVYLKEVTKTPLINSVGSGEVHIGN